MSPPSRHAVAAILLLVLSGAGVAAESGQARRPNVLILLVDDLKPALGCYGDSSARSPNLDRLAQRGRRFELAYCNTAVCAPSRFNLMTGSRSTSLGIYTFGRDFRRVVPDAVTLPQYFQRHGYSTEALGKVYHIGHGCDDDKASWSVPHFKDLVIEYRDPARAGAPRTKEEALFANLPSRGLPRGPAMEMPEVADDAYADGRVAREVARRLRAHAGRPDQPFFLAAGFARPHLPFSVPRKYWNLHDPARLPKPARETPPVGAPREALKIGGEIQQYLPVPDGAPINYPEALKRELTHGYYASVSFVDAQIGIVLDALAETGLERNTIVVLWGDHGFLLGELGMWTKHVNFELANRIPLIIAGPGIDRPGVPTRQIAETVDLYPTLAALAGLPPPVVPQPIDGTNLLPTLEDPARRVDDHAYHCFLRQRLGRAIRTESHRLVLWQDPGEPAASATIELYEYSSGPLESRNVAESQPEKVAELMSILRRHPDPVSGRAQGGRQEGK